VCNFVGIRTQQGIFVGSADRPAPCTPGLLVIEVQFVSPEKVVVDTLLIEIVHKFALRRYPGPLRYDSLML
jgi:hypothetical protein